ncbi:MAG: hypothetical protein ACLKAK_03670 [Alkaliphilus sp.]
MFNRLKKGMLSEIEEKYGVKFETSEEEWKEAVRVIQRDLLHNNISFKKEVSYNEFVKRIYIYLSMKQKLGIK